ncbi:hypothetical protein KH400_16410 [Desertibacillus haloalkaliphilus]|nr:hypothetical protein [Desertibacillus haloalkaliphilus]
MSGNKVRDLSGTSGDNVYCTRYYKGIEVVDTEQKLFEGIEPTCFEELEVGETYFSSSIDGTTLRVHKIVLWILMW